MDEGKWLLKKSGHGNRHLKGSWYLNLINYNFEFAF
jgi:hypothetical protein